MDCYVINTGQQQPIVDLFLHEFDIKANVSIKFKKKRGLGTDFSFLVGQLGLMLDIQTFNRPLVVVQGDTLSAIAGALAAFNLSIPIIHIEAGLRSGDQLLPFPEEGYRRMITQIASHHFAPTELARINLINSGVQDRFITVSGNTGIDSFLFFLNNETEIQKKQKFSILVTLHRRENFGKKIEALTSMLDDVAKDFENVEINFIKHTNPQVVNSYNRNFLNNRNISIHQPLSYKETVRLLAGANLIITDSGGIQEESSYLGTPIVVARSNTERKEIINSNCLSITTNPAEIRKLIASEIYSGKSNTLLPLQFYGEGNSAKIVAEKLYELKHA